jgi:hypothetical protein
MQDSEQPHRQPGMEQGSQARVSGTSRPIPPILSATSAPSSLRDMDSPLTPSGFEALWLIYSNYGGEIRILQLIWH